MYHLWLKNEVKKIHDKYKVERDKIEEEAFVEGFNSNAYSTDIKSKERAKEMIKRLKEINQQEQEEYSNFKNSIGQNWSTYVETIIDALTNGN